MVVIGNIGNLSNGKTNTSIMLYLTEERFKHKRLITNIKTELASWYLPHNKFLEHYEELLTLNEECLQYELEKYWHNSVWIIDEIEHIADARLTTRKANINITAFFTLLGKLDVDVIYTAQFLDSQVDKRIRLFTNIILQNKRVDKNFNELFLMPRYIDEPIYIHIRMLIDRETEIEEKEIIYDPSPFFKYYNSKQAILMR